MARLGCSGYNHPTPGLPRTFPPKQAIVFFILPAKSGGGKWITLRTSDLAGLPDEDVRVDPQHAKAMPKIIDPTGSGAVSTALRARHYRLIGLEIIASSDVKNT